MILLLILININRNTKVKPWILIMFIIIFLATTSVGMFLMKNELNRVVMKKNENKDIATIRIEKGQSYENNMKVDLSLDNIKGDKQQVVIAIINNDKTYFVGKVYLEVFDVDCRVIFEEQYDVELKPNGKITSKINIDKGFRGWKYKAVKLY